MHWFLKLLKWFGLSIAYSLFAIGVFSFGIYVYKETTGRYIVFNHTPSVPVGIYLVDPTAKPSKGDYVVFKVEPQDWMILNGMDFGTNRYVKLVGATAGDHVKQNGNDIVLCKNIACDAFEILATRSAKHVKSLQIPELTLPNTIPEKQIMVFGVTEYAMDSRYFGPVDSANIYGMARPVITFN
jgi:type IV secretory pathway protease TraF